ncbi:GNAT family N-acetyltransferase [Georgenia sp. SYP-B2076]|uniref:GNAT family N-acetyltransferase n=1 Tax=Georgenia sp. SYP-B2076 TaxID=2495881 RepID=UPI000F8D5F31|nr:GNAT family N-acetyltransferase [Georgenia sp. SYP-B2076]
MAGTLTEDDRTLDDGTPGGVAVVRVTGRDQLEQAWAVRMEVFVAEQHVPAEEEVDELDTAPTTTHVLAVETASGAVLGTGRLLTDPAHPGEVHLGRLAVRAAARGRGVGARMVVAIEGIALAEHGTAAAAAAPEPLSVTVVLSAQEQALDFYRRLGYELVSGERYLDAGIWHQDMAHRITA